MGNDRIPAGPSLKYLGLILDGRLSFKEHFRQLAPRVEKVVEGSQPWASSTQNRRADGKRPAHLYVCGTVHDDIRGSHMGNGGGIVAAEHPATEESAKAYGPEGHQGI